MAAAQFISEPIDPVAKTAEAAAMARGEPGLPQAFTWRGRRFTIDHTLKAWKQSQPEGRKKGNERYLRRHYWTVRTTTGEMMTLYCLRTARRGQHRWFLYTIDDGPDA
ncbi:MAG: hypothetical protein GVY16_05875 [Planctomycetes bacterium]|nr:hypothetical protein [Planctomycetota bacterium]